MSSQDHMEWHMHTGKECKGYEGRPDAIGNCDEYDAKLKAYKADAEPTGEAPDPETAKLER